MSHTKRASASPGARDRPAPAAAGRKIWSLMFGRRFHEAIAIGRECRHSEGGDTARTTMLDRFALCLRVEACRFAGRGQPAEARSLFAEEESVLRQRIAIRASWRARHSLLRSLLDQRKPAAELADDVRSLDPVVHGRVRLDRHVKHAICMAAGVGHAIIGNPEECRSSLAAAARAVEIEGAGPDPSFLGFLLDYGVQAQPETIQAFQHYCSGLPFETGPDLLAKLGIVPSPPRHRRREA